MSKLIPKNSVVAFAMAYISMPYDVWLSTYMLFWMVGSFAMSCGIIRETGAVVLAL
jgi:hypothetical protein